MADYEKNEVVFLERTTSDDSTVDDRLNSLTEEEQKKLIWRIDTRLVLTLGFMVSDLAFNVSEGGPLTRSSVLRLPHGSYQLGYCCRRWYGC